MNVRAELTRVERELRAVLERVEKGKKTQIGDVVNWAGVLYIRVDDQPGAGDKANFRKLGKAPAGWKKGDPNPYKDKAKQILTEAGKAPADEKPQEESAEAPGTLTAKNAVDNMVH